MQNVRGEPSLERAPRKNQLRVRAEKSAQVFEGFGMEVVGRPRWLKTPRKSCRSTRSMTSTTPTAPLSHHTLGGQAGRTYAKKLRTIWQLAVMH